MSPRHAPSRNSLPRGTAGGHENNPLPRVAVAWEANHAWHEAPHAAGVVGIEGSGSVQDETANGAMVPPEGHEPIRPIDRPRGPLACGSERSTPLRSESELSVSPPGGGSRFRSRWLMMIPFRKDRRQSKRDRLNLPVRFRIFLPSHPEIASSFLPGQLENYSHEGLAMLTNAIHSNSLHAFHPIPTTSEQCLLEIKVPSQGDDLILQGRVVWYDRNEEGHPFLFRVGIQLIDPTKDLKRQIEDSIKEHVSSASVSI